MFWYLGLVNMPLRSTIYSTAGSYNWTVPNGVTSAWVSLIGGGSGGQGGAVIRTAGCNAGGAGETIFGALVAVSGATMPVVVGAGGTGGSGVDTIAGGTSSFGALRALGGSTAPYTEGTASLVAGGGVGGGVAATSGSDGNLGSMESILFTGGASPSSPRHDTGGPFYGGGAPGHLIGGATSGSARSGAGGGASIYGVGGAGSLINTNGVSALSTGSGGGGGGSVSSGTTTGGAGKDGLVAIFWIEP